MNHAVTSERRSIHLTSYFKRLPVTAKTLARTGIQPRWHRWVSAFALLVAIFAFLVTAIALRFSFYRTTAVDPHDALAVTVSAALISVGAFLCSALFRDRNGELR